ncbi:serine hydrolase [Sphingomonas sp. Root710]|uniref:serine hydrolase domain-containing protein n=1 Tax=Sphingomonas sp. Root710 TaxID=1736594 RepID=UPI0006FDAA6A|nr:serine hydrolase [Sphingomonas sp. Root710]KRB86786.1 serine hydrolase [Sphingomonas sp. Root710]
MRIAGLLIVLLSFLAQDARADPVVPAAVRLSFDRAAIGVAETRGVADRQSGRPVTADDPVRIASISKLAVALGVMRMVEAGELDLDRDVSAYLGWQLRNPAFPDPPISLRLLLSHRASLTDAADYALPFDMSLREKLDDPRAWDGEHSPGSFFRYANLNFPVIASVMERVSGERFDRLMARLVIDPLGLKACFNWVACDNATIARAVTLYGADGTPLRDDDHGLRPACPIVPAQDGGCDLSRWRPGFNGASFSPQGGLRISMRDLARIGQMLLNQGRVKGRRFLSPGSVDLLLTPVWTYDGRNGVTGETTPGTICRYGLASQTLATGAEGCRDDLFGDGVPRVGHAGEAYGLRSGLWIDRATGSGTVYFVTAVDDDAALGQHSAFTRVEETIAAVRR